MMIKLGKVVAEKLKELKKELGMPYTQIIHLALIEFIKNKKA